MEEEKTKKLKLKKKLRMVTSILMVIIASFLFFLGMWYGVDTKYISGNTLDSIRFGLCSASLIASGTAVLIAVYVHSKKR